MMAPPGYPNIYSVFSAMSDLMSASAPLIFSVAIVVLYNWDSVS